MSGNFNADRLFADPAAVAALVPASQIFTLLTRVFDLPSDWAALVSDVKGGHRVFAPGAVIPKESIDEVLFVRATPIDVQIAQDGLPSKDKYQCLANVDLRVLLIPERGELVSFRNALLGSQRSAGADTLARHLEPHVRAALVELAGAGDADALLGGKDCDLWSRAIADALQPVCFGAGLKLEAAPAVRFDSPTYRQVRVTEEQVARRRAEHAARRQLEQAIETAQADHLGHLETMLARLKQAADASPDVELPDLMRTFSERQRGELYEALFAAEPVQASTRWIVVATSEGLHFFEPQSSGQPARSVGVDGVIGGIRSVQCVRKPDGACCLLVGASRGLYEFEADATEPSGVFAAGAGREVRGGFNAAALSGDRVWASHSEMGLLCWHRAAPGESRPLGSETGPDEPVRALESSTRQARAVRGAQFYDGRIWCTIDGRVAAVVADTPAADPIWYVGSESVLASLAVGPAGVFAGNAAGQILHWAHDKPDTLTVLHAGNHRPAESIHLLDTGGVERLFFTDTSLAVHARVRGDTFTCRYEAGGQTIRRVEVAPDLIVATNDVRDRLVCWSPTKPARPAAVVPVARLTRHSVQDVCLVPVS